MNDPGEGVNMVASENKFSLAKILPSWRKLLLMGFGVLGVLFLVFVALYAVYTFTIREYSEIQVANVSPNSATVVWVSPTKEPGVALAYKGEAPTRKVGKYGADVVVGYDDRDYSDAELDAARKTLERVEDGEKVLSSTDIETEVTVNNYGFYYVHHVTFRDLEPNTTYEVLLGDGYVFNSGENDREVMYTTNTLADEVAKVPSPSYGVIYKENGDLLTDGVVKMHIIDETGEVVSNEILAPLGNNGSWYVDLNSFKTITGEPFFEVYTEIEFQSMNEVVDVITKEGVYRNYLIPSADSPAPDLNLSSETLISKGTLSERLYSSLDSLVFEANACEGGAYCGGCISKCVSWGDFGGAGGCNELIEKKCNGGGGGGGDNNNPPPNQPPPPQEPPPDNSGGGRCPGQVYCSACGCKSYDWFKENGLSGCAEAEKEGKCGGGGDDGGDDKEPDPTPPPPKGKCCKTPSYNSNGDVYWSDSGQCSYGSVNKSKNDCNGVDDGADDNTPPPNPNPSTQGYCCDGGNTWQSVDSPIGNCKPGMSGYLGRMSISACRDKKGENDDNTPPPNNDTKGTCCVDQNGKHTWNQYSNWDCPYQKVGNMDKSSCDRRNVTKPQGDTVPQGACCKSQSGNHTWAGANKFSCSYGSAGRMSEAECKELNKKSSDDDNKEEVPKQQYEICCYNKNGDKKYHPVRYSSKSCPSYYEKRVSGKEGSGWPGSCTGSGSKDDPGGGNKEQEPKTPPRVEQPKEAQKVKQGVIESKYCDDSKGQCDPSKCPAETTPELRKTYEVIWADEYETQVKEVKWTFWYVCIKDEPPEPEEPPEDLRSPCLEGAAQSQGGTCVHDCQNKCTNLERCVRKNYTPYGWEFPFDYFKCEDMRNRGTSDPEGDDGQGDDNEENPPQEGIPEEPPEPIKSACVEGPAQDAGGTCVHDCQSKCTNLERCERRELQPIGFEYPFDYFKCIDMRNRDQSNNIKDLGVDLVSEIIGKINDMLSFGASAQEDNNPTIIFSPENEGYLVDEDGKYFFVYQGELYEVLLTGGEDTVYIIYIDKNDNSTYEPDVDVTVAEDPAELLMDKEKGAFGYDINVGFNYVSFNFIPDESGIMASELLQRLNTMYPDHEEPFYSVATYDSGQWKIIGSREGEIYGANDFQIVPGKGYLLRSKYQFTIELTGFEIISPVPVQMSEGWNLVAIHGSDKAYTAESWIDSIDKVNTLDADNVTRWDYSRGRYDGLQKSEGQVYGFDYPIFEQQAYFVRIISGTDRWLPE